MQSVLQCDAERVAVCGSMLQCVTRASCRVCCSVWQSVLQCGAERVAVCGSMMHCVVECVAEYCSVLRERPVECVSFDSKEGFWTSN